jgi:hypothetical protein
MESGWNETFLDENVLAYDTSDDSDTNFGPIGHDSSSEDSEEIGLGPAIQLTHNQTRRDRLQGDITDKVCHVLHVMEELGLNLTLFLDSLSWGDQKCISNPMIRNARTGLMTSAELPSILRRWWRPPRVQGSSHSRPSGASRVMEDFAHECISQKVNKEMESIAQVFKSGGDDDVSEERLTNTTFPAAIEQVKSHGSLVWSLLGDFSQIRGHQVPHKKIDTVWKLFWASFLSHQIPGHSHHHFDVVVHTQQSARTLPEIIQHLLQISWSDCKRV